MSFNPRAHAGRDDSEQSSLFDKDVSIHAPTRGATLRRLQPHKRRAFQSTRPRGARQNRKESMQAVESFNPRAHAGRDWKTKCRQKSEPVFQSTRPRGARRQVTSLPSCSNRFQSTRPRGARPGPVAAIVSVYCFNPRAHAGRDSTLYNSFKDINLDYQLCGPNLNFALKIDKCYIKRRNLNNNKPLQKVRNLL